MTIQLKHLTLILGGTLLAIGLLIGVLPVKAAGTSCGTAFTGQSDNAKVSDLTMAMMGRVTDTEAACEDAISGRRVPALALTIPGALLLLAGTALSMNTQTFAKPKGATVGNT